MAESRGLGFCFAKSFRSSSLRKIGFAFQEELAKVLAFLRRRRRRQRILLFKVYLKKIKRLLRVFLVPTFMAEARGFEPPRPFSPHDFESCAFNHSATLPPLILTKITLNYNRLRANKKFHHHYSIRFLLKKLIHKNLTASKYFTQKISSGRELIFS